MKIAKKIWDAIKLPFEIYACCLDEERSANLDGAYDGYWARKNKRAELKELRREYIANRKAIIKKWRI